MDQQPGLFEFWNAMVESPAMQCLTIVIMVVLMVSWRYIKLKYFDTPSQIRRR